MKIRDFTENVRNITLDYLKKLADSSDEIKGLKAQAANYSHEYAAKLLQEAQEKREKIIREGREAVSAEIQAFSEEAIAADTPNGADITADAALLTSGIDLTPEDIDRIWEKAPDNRTMQRLLHEYADKHGMDIAHTFIPGSDMADAAGELLHFYNNAMDRPEFADIWEDPDYYSQAIPDVLQAE